MSIFVEVCKIYLVTVFFSLCALFSKGGFILRSVKETQQEINTCQPNPSNLQKNTKEPEKPKEEERKRIKTTETSIMSIFVEVSKIYLVTVFFSLCTFLKRRIHLKIRIKQRCKRSLVGNQHMSTKPFKPTNKTQKNLKSKRKRRGKA